MTTGTGVFNLINKKPGDSVSEYSMSVAAKSQHASPFPNPYMQQPTKVKKDLSLTNIMKSNVLNWYLFKSGLKTKIIDKMSNDVALQEGLELIYKDPIRAQEMIFDSLKLVPEDKSISDKPEGNLFKAKTIAKDSQPALKRTISKAEMLSKKTFLPQKDTWSPEVTEFFVKIDGGLSIGEQVLTKIRKNLSKEGIDVVGVF